MNLGDTTNPQRKNPGVPNLHLTRARRIVTKQDSNVSASTSINMETSVQSFPMPVIGAAEREEHHIEGPLNILSTINTSKDILCVQYSEDKKHLGVGFMDGIVGIYDDSKTLINEMYDQEIQTQKCPVTAIRYRPTLRSQTTPDCFTCSYVNGYVKCWNFSYQQLVYTIHEKRPTLGLTYHTRLPKFITFGGDARIYLYDEETRVQERIFCGSDSPKVMDGHSSRIFAGCFHPRSNYELISGGWDDTIQFWDVRVPRSVRYISGPHICGDAIEFTKTGREILTCSWRKTEQAQIWDYGSGKLLSTVDSDIYPSMLYCGKYISKFFIVCGGVDPNLIRLVDLRTQLTQSILRGVTGGVYSLDFGSITKSKAKKDGTKKPMDMGLPKVTFCSGKSFYEIEFAL